jgi:TRAF3-interacting protein 1
MGDLNLDELVALARDKISAIISKPKMTEKLLSKPPFRFLHDTVSAITQATGFAAGLYNESELDSAAISDKHAKMSYLDKIFNLVGICMVSFVISVCPLIYMFLGFSIVS